MNSWPSRATADACSSGCDRHTLPGRQPPGTPVKRLSGRNQNSMFRGVAEELFGRLLELSPVCLDVDLMIWSVANRTPLPTLGKLFHDNCSRADAQFLWSELGRFSTSDDCSIQTTQPTASDTPTTKARYTPEPRKSRGSAWTTVRDQAFDRPVPKSRRLMDH